MTGTESLPLDYPKLQYRHHHVNLVNTGSLNSLAILTKLCPCSLCIHVYDFKASTKFEIMFKLNVWCRVITLEFSIIYLFDHGNTFNTC